MHLSNAADGGEAVGRLSYLPLIRGLPHIRSHTLGAILLETVRHTPTPTTMLDQDIPSDLSLSGALQRVVDSSQNVMLAHIASLQQEMKEDLGSALRSLFLIAAGLILINSAWLSLMAFTLSGLSGHLSLLASLALVGTFTGLTGAGLAVAGVRRLRQRQVEPVPINHSERAH
jgi:hypothetical protein